MSEEKGGSNPSAAAPVPSMSAEQFAASLKRRDRAAQGLERDLLTEVPLLYGSPGRAGDPGILLAELHRDEMLRRNGGGVPKCSRKETDVSLPYQRTTKILVAVLLLLMLVLD